MPNPGRMVWASDFNQWVLAGVAANTYTWPSPQAVEFFNPYNSSFFSFATTRPVLINDIGTPANSEVTTPTAVSINGFTPGTLAHSHSSFLVQSGTAGLQEALDLATGAGSSTHPVAVLLDALWWLAANAIPGTNGATIIGAATGSTSKVIIDTTTTPYTFYTWSGSAFVAASTPGGLTTANGASIAFGSLSENLTLSTSGATSTTTGNLLPANSWIQGIVFRVTTAINNVTNWQPGDGTTVGRFGAVQTGLTLGTTFVGNVFDTTGIASATTGAWQAANAHVVITTTGTQNTTGAIRITTFFFTLTPPTS